MKKLPRFTFIGHALRGDGPFRPAVTYDSEGAAVSTGASYLVRYPRESAIKFARRVELGFYSSPLARVTSKFTSYIAAKPVQRDIVSELLKAVYEDADGKGNNADIFWHDFMMEAKSRGSMLVLVDMPPTVPDNLQTQLTDRAVPYWTPILPETLVDWEIADDGKFEFAEFAGSYSNADGEQQPCTWRFDREGWACKDEDDAIVEEGEHNLGECPLLIFTESGDFPCYGPFSPVADLSKRLFNLDSELDEILRSQTFSLLTMQVPDGSTDEQRMEAAKSAGETIGASNLMMHSGSTPAFIAPADGPANVYMERIRDLRTEIQDVGLEVATINQQESGIAMQMRFQAINSELGRFSARMEKLEERVWEITARWLSLTEEPMVAWPRDFNVADPVQELEILSLMQQTAMPTEVLIEQQKRVVMVQFNGIDIEDQEDMLNVLNQGRSGVEPAAEE